MHTITIFLTIVGVVSCDIGIGYRYKVPHTSYGVPSYQVTGNNDGYNIGYTSGSGGTDFVYRSQSSNQGGYQGSNFGQATQQNTGYQTYTDSGNLGGSNSGAGYQLGGNYQSVNGLGGQKYQSSGSSGGFNSVVSASLPSYQLGGSVGQNGYQSLNQYQTSAVQRYQEYYNQVEQQPPQVFKHFYVHAAPEDNEAPKLRRPVVLPAPQKHYKIIFIKTPSPAPAAPQIIPVQPQNEEKTIVYVLVKKPDEAQDVVLPKVEQKAPSKPEVYFIKYNTKEGSQSVINNIVSDYNKGHGQESSSFSSGGTLSVGGSGTLDDISDTSNIFTSQSSVASSGGENSNSLTSSQTENQILSGSFGSQSLGINSGSTIGQIVSTTDSGISSAGYDSRGGVNGISTTSTVGNSVSNLNLDKFNTISTSQGVPHETYGPPNFRSS